MNTKILIAVACIAVLLSCKKKSEEEPGILDTIEGFSNLKKIADEAEKIEDITEKLIATPAISKEKLKNILPESLEGFKRTEFIIGNQLLPDITSADATYKKDDQEIKLSIMDGAGETASALINLVRLQLAADFERNDDYGYEKTITLQGEKAIEKVEKDSYSNTENSELVMIINDRFLVSLKGENISINKLKNSFTQLDLAELKTL